MKQKLDMVTFRLPIEEEDLYSLPSILGAVISMIFDKSVINPEDAARLLNKLSDFYEKHSLIEEGKIFKKIVLAVGKHFDAEIIITEQ